jgi:hypothetical protein
VKPVVATDHPKIRNNAALMDRQLRCEVLMMAFSIPDCARAGTVRAKKAACFNARGLLINGAGRRVIAGESVRVKG